MKFDLNPQQGETPAQETPQPQQQAPATTPQAQPQGGASFMMTGQAAQTAMVQQQAAAQSNQGARRFFIPAASNGQTHSRVVTFITGNLDPSGVFDQNVPCCHEHTVKIGGNWRDVVCQDYRGECVLCTSGKRSSFSTFFQVIDHTEFTRKANTPEAKQDGFMPKLFVAKAATRNILQAYATEYGGLVGRTFQITRSAGDKVPRVGDVFIDKGDTNLQEMAAHAMQKYVLTQEEVTKRFTPITVADELFNPTPEELAQIMGVGLAQPAGAAGNAAQGFEELQKQIAG